MVHLELAKCCCLQQQDLHGGTGLWPISEEAFLWANTGGKALRSLFVGHNFGRI